MVAKKTAATATKKAASTSTKKAANAKKVAKETVKKTVAKTAVKKTAAEPATGTAPKNAAERTTKAARSTGAAKTRAATAADKTGARTVAAKKTVHSATATEGVSDAGAVPQARAGELAVRPGEDPWTPAEVAEARAELESEVLRLRSEIHASESALTGLMRDSGDGAGDDQADTGAKNITREHELSLAANAREMLEQTEHALERLDTGTYGLCEVCGKPIGKARMQAFPRATLCVEDKQKQERRG
ncbi:TraR/DksA family transcriptional regulator [Streptomyces solicathayae]|uniref:TraR/DksA C4-type zinc finger protein n=1 Tax=Streptomyces solicathayae TaxID=3081768 RepID=A0ABZ0LZE5_9ACTN|nr:TraR/DksA C4-type zinc finger protein [Streptomyces sp. HUAS YS2]WOX24895.1 TraR/DksA C4-type zinc finger protein [Streptomyces sp. HUAS YS2]